MTNYKNLSSMALKHETLQNDRCVLRDTMHQRQAADFDLENSGRFAKPASVVGSTPVVEYPMAAPNWSADPVGVEPPSGVEIDAHEPVGEVSEVNASLGASSNADVPGGGGATTNRDKFENASPPNLPDELATTSQSSFGSVDARGQGDATTTEASRERTAQSPLVASPNPKRSRRL